MPQRASQRKFGKSLKLHETDVCRREKCTEKDNVCFEEVRRESIKENEKIAVDMSQDVCV